MKTVWCEGLRPDPHLPLKGETKMEDNLFYVLGATVHQAIRDYVKFKPEPIKIKKGEIIFGELETAKMYLFHPFGLEELLHSGGLNIDLENIRIGAVIEKERLYKRKNIKYTFSDVEQKYLDKYDELKEQREEYEPTIPPYNIKI